MLVLTRKTNEEIFCTLDDTTKVRIVILGIAGTNRVKIGIEAPLNVEVVRAEVARKEPA